MKRILISLTLLLGMLMSYAGNTGLPEESENTLQTAIALIDDNRAGDALNILDKLAEAFPENYYVQYERMYALYALGRYGEVAEMGKNVVKLKNRNELAFQLYGNALDMLGEPEKAQRIYRQGIRQFPEAGELYLELGNLAFAAENYTEALEDFNLGIEADPSFPTNYYRGAYMFLNSDNPIWGLVYAESYILLDPTDNTRFKEMSESAYDCFRNHIKVLHEHDSTKVTIDFAPRQAPDYIDAGEVYIEFPEIYETCLVYGLLSLDPARTDFVPTIAQLSALRKAALERYWEKARFLYGNSMYLLAYQKAVLDAGHWDAYNHLIFGGARLEEAYAWLDTHKEEYDNFVKWYNEHPYVLDGSHTVGYYGIFRNYRPVTLAQSLEIKASLLENDADH